MVLVVSGLALILWYFDQMGGADAKGWIVFSLMGSWVLLGAALGMLLWFLLIKWFSLIPEDVTIPGYPSYLIGIGLVFLLQFTWAYAQLA
jgi:hypothetical protein